MLTIANVEQAAAWDGSEGDHWTEHSEQYDRASRRQWNALLESGLILRDDRVLDIGCGTGQSTRETARLASSALGVDLSARMLVHARELAAAEGLTNVSFVQADAQVHPFDADSVDLAISKFGAMFFSDPVAAFTNIGRALRSGGRIGLLAWRELDRNEWLLAVRGALAVGRTLPTPPPDAPTPFSLADPARVRRILADAGYRDVGFDSIDEPIEFGSNADDAYSFLRGTGIAEGLTQDLDDAKKAEAFDALRAAVDAHDTGAGVLMNTSAWLITATRR